MKPRLVLFDIDLTILHTAGSGLCAMTDVLREFTGHEGDVIPIRFDGKTDPLIVPELFEVNGYALTPDRYEPFMQRYIAKLDEVQRTQTDWFLFPGVKEIISRIWETEGFHLALVTGNDERGARLKLAPFDLNRYFPIGGFASDSAVRRELIPIAIRRAEAHYGMVFDRRNVIVIGDSVGDVKSANAEGIRCLAVMTGRTTREELRNAGGCTIIPDLSDGDKVMEILSCESA